MTKDEYRKKWLEQARLNPDIWRAMARKAGTADQNHPSFIALIENEFSYATRQATRQAPDKLRNK